MLTTSKQSSLCKCTRIHVTLTRQVGDSLCRYVRDRRANYKQSLEVLRQVRAIGKVDLHHFPPYCCAQAKRARPSIITKSSIMLGLGETDSEVLQAMRGATLKHYFN